MDRQTNRPTDGLIDKAKHDAPIWWLHFLHYYQKKALHQLLSFAFHFEQEGKKGLLKSSLAIIMQS